MSFNTSFLQEYDWNKIGVIVFITALIITSTVLFFKYKRSQEILNNPQVLVKEETKQIVSKISRFMELPNEEFTLVTVNDVSKLKNQLFFKNAKNGDKVLIYINAKKAILYRPSTNKIIEVSALDMNNKANATSGAQLFNPATP